MATKQAPAPTTIPGELTAEIVAQEDARREMEELLELGRAAKAAQARPAPPKPTKPVRAATADEFAAFDAHVQAALTRGRNDYLAMVMGELRRGEEYAEDYTFAVSATGTDGVEYTVVYDLAGDVAAGERRR